MLRCKRFILFVPLLAAFGAACDRRAPAASGGAVAPRRIVSIAPNASEIIALLGEADRLVGVSRYCNHPPELAARVKVGGLIDPDLEAILRLEPDLVVIRGRIPEVERLCEENGIRLHRDPTESFEDIFTAVGQLGALLQREEKAGALVEDIRRRVRRISTAIAGRPKPRVLFSTERNPESLGRVITLGKDTFIDEIITLAGGENVFGHLEVRYPEVSLESILSAQPDVIIEVIPGAGLPDGVLREQIVEQWRQLGSMPAVEHGRVHVITDNELIIPSPRVVKSILRLARLLHPEVRFDEDG